MSKQLKPLPKFANEAEEQAFWEKHIIVVAFYC